MKQRLPKKIIYDYYIMADKDPTLHDVSDREAARLGRTNFSTLNKAYGDLHGAHKSLEDLKFLGAEVNAAHDKKKSDHEQKNRSYDRMSLYYGDITESNKSYTSIFTTIYYILIVIFVIVIILKKNTDPYNYPIVAGFIIIPILLSAIVKLIY